MTDTIVMDGISKIYSVGGEEVRALDSASLRIAPGEFVSVVGPSGSGKSTLMNIIGCLDVADEGEYLLDGQRIESYSEDQLAKIRNKKIGFIFQGFNLLPKMTAEENVELPLIYQRLTLSERKERVREVLDKVGLTSRAQHRPSELSGGQQQRVAIARALATHPSLLLADEPTGNLDSKTSADIMRLFSSLYEQGNTIVVITHDNDIARQARRTVRILDGRVYEEGV
ncbi:MAG: ABC transporter ATP-binding protein [Clostridiaceae bacterium]|nr:ABC transporter ATP-binding protein [Eubacteriales bacterium]